MPTAIKFRKLLNAKYWELKAQNPFNTAYNGGPGVRSRLADQYFFQFYSVSAMQLYSTIEDGWVSMASPGLATFAAGACAEHSAIGPSGTATAGTSTTITTNLTLAFDLRGYKIRLTGGPGAGDERTILSNTVGANSVITVSSAFSETPTASTTYTLLTGTLFMFGGGTVTTGTFRKYDFATNTFSNLSVTGLPATFGTDGYLLGTPSIVSLGEVTSLATGTATSATSTTLVNSGKAWATNQWANAYQVRITGGTGAGQTRIISINTGTTLTVASAWTTNPDATSTYSIEGNDDYLYLLGNSAVTMYRYSNSSGTWTTLSPGVARGGAPGAGCLSWVATQAPNDDWTTENAIINGRRLYSFRGNSGTTLDYFDLPSNSWVNALTYGPGSIAPTGGFRVAYYKGNAYFTQTGTGNTTAPLMRYNSPKNMLEPWHQMPAYRQQTPVYNSVFVAEYVDGADVVPYLYMQTESSTTNTPMFRTPIL